MSPRVEAWMEGYVRAWRTNDPGDVARLFTEDAVYDPQVGGDPWRGRDAVVTGWIASADEPGSWEFSWQPLLETDDTAVVTGETHYREDPPKVYRNLFVIQFGDDDRCRSFTEWYVRVRQG